MDVYQLLTDFAGPIATVFAAVAALFVTSRLGKSQLLVARQQADLATIRLKHDLFDRRFEIYEAVIAFLIEIMQSSNISSEGISKFVRGTQKAVFVFDQSFTEYLEELRKQAIVLQEQASILRDQNVPISPERSRAAQRRSEVFLWFMEQFSVLVQRMKPFMALDENTANRPAFGPEAQGRRKAAAAIRSAEN